MAKQFITCPFSKGKCIQCAIYRGRHAEICFAAGYHGGEFKNLMEPKPKPTNPVTRSEFPFPEIPDTPRRIKNVEECVMAKETITSK